jgi:transposase
MSRRTSLSKDMIEMTYDLLKEGHYNEDVAEYIGVSQQTFYNWMNKGEELHEMSEEEYEEHIKQLPNETTKKNAKLFLEFFETVKRANTEAKMQALRNIRKAGKKSWQAEAWFLERKFRSQFARTAIVVEDNNEEKGQPLLNKMIAGVDAIAESDDE